MIVLCPWCGMPVIEHEAAAVEHRADGTINSIYFCPDAPPFAVPVLDESGPR